MNPENTKRSFGPLIAIVIIIILIVLGAFYFWGGKMPVSKISPETEQAAVAPVSPSDDVDSLQADLQATNPG
ncbi:MAG TPA: hypothetical protein VFA15_02965, partial [Nitrososphaera sp.]|nr:hypothetical protein [Nitrososphaera sp.]